MPAETGDARDRLIEHNLRLVAHIAKKYQSSSLDADDLVSIGSIGLIKAVDTFRPEAGRLTTYASRCIENEMLMQLRAGRKNRGTVQLDEPIGADKEGNEIRLTDLLGTDKDAVSDAAETGHRIGAGQAPFAHGVAGRARKAGSSKCAMACATAFPARSTRWRVPWEYRVRMYRALKKRRWQNCERPWTAGDRAVRAKRRAAHGPRPALCRAAGENGGVA